MALQYKIPCVKCLATIAAVAGLLTVSLLTACTAAAPAPQPPTGPGGPRLITSPIMVKLTLEELVARADWIVVGTVTEKKSQWNADRTSIYTLVTLAVEQWLKGQSGDNNMVIKVPGGEVDGTTQQMEDAASFRTGEKVLVFLGRNDDGTAGVVGGFQGKNTIEGGNVVSSNQSLKDFISQIKAEVSKPSK